MPTNTASTPQLESTCATGWSLVSTSITTKLKIDPRRYFNTRFIPRSCTSDGFSSCFASWIATTPKSGRVLTSDIIYLGYAVGINVQSGFELLLILYGDAYGYQEISRYSRPLHDPPPGRGTPLVGCSRVFQNEMWWSLNLGRSGTASLGNDLKGGRFFTICALQK